MDFDAVIQQNRSFMILCFLLMLVNVASVMWANRQRELALARVLESIERGITFDDGDSDIESNGSSGSNGSDHEHFN